MIRAGVQHRFWRNPALPGLLALLLAGLTVLYFMAEQIRLGAEAYVFGYPLVIMDLTRGNSAQTLGPENQLQRVRRFPDAGFREVVRPNADTLYTSAFLDMDKGPWVFEMPVNDQRFELMAFMDAWTNVFAAPGTRSSTAGGKFLLAGPLWKGEPAAGLTLLRAPTRMVWLIGRTQTKGVADYALVHALQDGLKLRSLSAWQGEREEAQPAWQRAVQPPKPPLVQMQAMSAVEFFERLAHLLVSNPPADADAAMMVKLQRIGVIPGQSPNWNWLERNALGLGRWMADWRVARELKKPRDLVHGWATPPAHLGNYGTDYATRFAVAMVGLGANLPLDASYPHARVDRDGRALDGSQRYRLHFKAGALPPVNAFWSVTAYNAQDFFIDNPLQRYALGDRDALRFNADGSLDLLVQAAEPPAEQVNNWLPVRAGEPFLLNARLYWPKPAALNGSWTMPGIERLD